MVSVTRLFSFKGHLKSILSLLPCFFGKPGLNLVSLPASISNRSRDGVFSQVELWLASRSLWQRPFSREH